MLLAASTTQDPQKVYFSVPQGILVDSMEYTESED
jgi:hypothetical protein